MGKMADKTGCKCTKTKQPWQKQFTYVLQIFVADRYIRYDFFKKFIKFHNLTNLL